MHELPADRFLRPQGQVSPVLDGRSITAHPADALAAGASSTVPLLIGTNQTESTLLGHLTELGRIAALDESGLTSHLKPSLGEHTSRIVDGYRRTWPKASPGDLLLYIEADRMMRIGSIQLAERKLAGSKAPVFMYFCLLDDHPRVVNDPFGERSLWEGVPSQ